MKSFLDSYALVEIANGNSAYAKYLDGECCTSVFNLLEFAYYLVKAGVDREKLGFFFKYRVEVDDGWLVEAAEFRHRNRKMDMSYAGAIGYIAALKTGSIFLTGDSAFKDIPHVEFVK